MDFYEQHSAAAIENATNVIYLLQVIEERGQIMKFRVVWIGKPARDGYGVIWMENIRRRTVIQNDDFLNRSPKT
jgi:hypothetical protein